MESSLVNRDRNAVIMWLCLCVLLVACMVLVGGYTRLSGSGLSITTWKPIHGTIPPLGDSQWQEEFDAYKASPQYQKINKGMSLEEFKDIFWPEFLHRLLGRMVGMVFLLPLLAFAARRSLSRRFGLRLVGIFALGGLQGLMGWLMVKSGLVDEPRVSHIRLALHLSLAFAIMALLAWAVRDAVEIRPRLTQVNAPARHWFKIWFVMLCIQVVYGAFTAGLHAGLVYNTWPDMNGQWIPEDLFSAPGWLGNLTHNLTMVQFIHRKMAVLLVLGYLFWWWKNYTYVTTNGLGKLCIGIAAVMAGQFMLGVVTLLNQAPLALALAHQMTALLLFTLAVVLMHRLSGREKAVEKAL